MALLLDFAMVVRQACSFLVGAGDMLVKGAAELSWVWAIPRLESVVVGLLWRSETFRADWLISIKAVARGLAGIRAGQCVRSIFANVLLVLACQHCSSD